jgi:hypothetical protein
LLQRRARHRGRCEIPIRTSRAEQMDQLIRCREFSGFNLMEAFRGKGGMLNRVDRTDRDAVSTADAGGWSFGSGLCRRRLGRKNKGRADTYTPSARDAPHGIDLDVHNESPG